DQLSGFYHVGLGVNDFQVRPEKTEQLLIEAGCRAVDSDFAEAIILGCSREVGFYQRLEKRLGVPVIDPAIAVLKRAEYAAILKRQCGWIPSRKWSCEAPPEDELEQFGIIDDGDVFGNRIIIGAL
ncbi:MAG: aspartate/glutamate racemase family protein, partial [Rhodobacteraceae bacterium]|nr:aspartate/glutamate racemase family protein [Paracoccaceae bacterium]